MPAGSRGTPVASAAWRAGYFAAQAGATLAWWMLIAVAPACRRWFAFGDDGRSLLPFLPGDVLFWVIGSCIAACGERSGAPWRNAVRHAVGGGMACSLVHAAGAAAIAGAGFGGVLLMLPAVALTLWLAWCSDP